MKVATVDTEVYYTTAEAADELGIHTDSVRRYCANYLEGRTPAIKAVYVGRSWMIPPEEIERFAEERKQVGRPRKS